MTSASRDFIMDSKWQILDPNLINRDTHSCRPIVLSLVITTWFTRDQNWCCINFIAAMAINIDIKQQKTSKITILTMQKTKNAYIYMFQALASCGPASPLCCGNTAILLGGELLIINWKKKEKEKNTLRQTAVWKTNRSSIVSSFYFLFFLLETRETDEDLCVCVCVCVCVCMSETLSLSLSTPFRYIIAFLRECFSLHYNYYSRKDC